MSEDVIKNLEPKILWQRFYEITRVPRPSKKEGKIIQHMKNLLKDLKVEFKEDSVGNILAKVPATPGLENSPIVILQGHVDMVCEKNKSKSHDFETDPIELIKEDGWIAADGTTLGSDNGIGVSAALAVITDKEVKHGPIEILMTVDEETGMTGASNINPGFMTGKILLNMDSEEEGTFYVGCSGGMDTVAEFEIEFEDTPDEFIPYELLITGLKGGHSGLDIISGRANAIKLLARTLKNI
jgi:dipeptidase D